MLFFFFFLGLCVGLVVVVAVEASPTSGSAESHFGQPYISSLLEEENI
jgi:hypothetical protein